MTEYKNLDKVSEAMFESALSKVKGQLEVKRKPADVGLKLLRRFEELKKYQALYVHNVTELKGKVGSFIILLVEKHLTIVERRKTGRQVRAIEEVEPILVFTVPTDIGRVIIRSETLADKLADLFYKVDIDFQAHPSFSKNYLVVGDKPDLVRQHLPEKLIQSLDKIEDLVIEINGNWGMVRAEKNLTETRLLQLISIGYKMT
jgi:hypothetical protein